MDERPLLEGLYREHRALGNDAVILQEAVRGLAASLDAGAETVLSRSLRGQFQLFLEALGHHFRQEQEGLFPEAQELLAQGAERGDVFGQFFAAEAEEDLGAHAWLTARVEEIIRLLDAAAQAGALKTESRARLQSLMGQVCDILRRHADKEDRFIYPMLQQALNYEQRQRVRQRLVELG